MERLQAGRRGANTAASGKLKYDIIYSSNSVRGRRKKPQIKCRRRIAWLFAATGSPCPNSGKNQSRRKHKMSNISMKAMLEAGVHFGHQTSRWNPKMSRFIFGERNGVHILDLQKTAKELKKACAYIKEEAKKGRKFLFVGTKKQAQESIRTEAERALCPCIHEKWPGGTLTNFATVRKSVERMSELEKWEAEGLMRAISKKEASRLTKELARLRKLLGGIKEMKSLPDILFIIDPVDTQGAVKEARTLGIPVVAVCDTNADPEIIDVPIPGNDDAARSIKLFCAAVADSIIEGRNEAAGVTVMPVEAAPAPEEKPVENPVMAEALKGINIEEQSSPLPTEEAAVQEAAGEEEIVEEKKNHSREEKKAKKTAGAKTAKPAKKPAKKSSAD
ncbi:MAG: 30S ribosomal protein S2 [Elusimicrobiota bacterium]|nr:30S ribosomal protein S2 [Elusimicrobiota bacterium]